MFSIYMFIEMFDPPLDIFFQLRPWGGERQFAPIISYIGTRTNLSEEKNRWHADGRDAKYTRYYRNYWELYSCFIAYIYCVYGITDFDSRKVECESHEKNVFIIHLCITSCAMNKIVIALRWSGGAAAGHLYIPTYKI